MYRRLAIAASAIALGLGIAMTAARAGDAAMDATLADIKATIGFVPSFIENYPPAALPGAWAQTKALEMSDGALTVKTKALISIAVAAQIPCQYCLFLDKMTAKRAGATDAEIGEAIAVAGLTRQWSTVLNGAGQDLEEFKKEFAGK